MKRGPRSVTCFCRRSIPIENAVNGVEGLRYIGSTSSQGTSTVTATFDLGTNLDIAATDVQNAVQSASGNLPNEVKQTGVTVSKNNGSFVMAIALQSSGGHDALFLSNFAELTIDLRATRSFAVIFANSMAFASRPTRQLLRTASRLDALCAWRWFARRKLPHRKLRNVRRAIAVW